METNLQTKTARAAIYCRISDDRTGDEAGVERQRLDCEAFCESHGFAIAGLYTDNDISAWSGKRRPQYEAMLDAVRHGEIDVIVCWHNDRLVRRSAELESLITVLEAGAVPVKTVTAGDYALESGDDRFRARILGAVAQKESDDKSRRIRRKHAEIAKAGKPSGGGARPFGYESDGMTVRPDEARLIVDAVRSIIAGGSVGGVVKRWTTDGVPTVSGKAKWTTQAVKGIVSSHRIAGQRNYKGEVFEAAWPGIISVEEGEAVRAVLEQARKSRSGSRRPAHRYLLGGILFCDLCGARMHSHAFNRRPHYFCDKNRGGCNSMAIVADRADEAVVAMAFTALGNHAVAAPGDAGGTEHLIAAVAADEAKLAKLSTDYYVDDAITQGEFEAARDGIAARLERNRADLAMAAVPASAIDRQGGADAVEARWDEMDLESKRLVLFELFERVAVRKGTPGRFNPERLAPVWRR